MARNNPIMWKRQLYQDLAREPQLPITNSICRRLNGIGLFHSDGVKIFDMFEFESSTSGYTCDYVDTDGGSYEMVRLATGVEVLFSFQAPLPRLSILFAIMHS
jgi:hypothetical protein